MIYSFSTTTKSKNYYNSLLLLLPSLEFHLHLMGDHHLLLHTTAKLEKHDIYHREEGNLRLYKEHWKTRPEHVKGQFFTWLDHGAGRFVSLPSCPRDRLNRERVHYVGKGQRKPYRVVFANGRLVYKSNGSAVHTRNLADTIYVLSPKKKFYVADKIGKIFYHSSFMSGGTIFCGGHLHVNNGRLESLSYRSGHYRPTAANFELLKGFLRGNHVDLTHVRMTGI